MAIMDSKLVVGVVVALVGLVLYFKRKANKVSVGSILSDTKVQDAKLKAAEDLIIEKIKEVESQDDSGLTKQERADRWK
jgi:hypothetical protein